MLGDYIVLFSSLLALISLFLPWSTGTQGKQWAFAYSEWASVIVIVFFLATLFLIFYPAVASEMSGPPLPFSTPVVFGFMGALLLLLLTYELGKYDCFICVGIGRGFGVWLAFLSAWAYLIGSVIKLGARPSSRSLDQGRFDAGREAVGRRR
jgi:cytochrome bd-type quinol oxidase subunit 2